MSQLGYAAAHDTSIEDRYTPAPVLAGKVVVISGIGPGLGRSLAVEAAKMGARLVIASRTEERLKEVATEVEALGAEVAMVVTDVTDEDSRANLVARSLEAFGSALFADALSESKGSIIMLNSCVAFSSQPEYAGYKLSKGALEHLASSLATELGPRGIRVNSVAPSYIYEDVNRGYFDFLAAVEDKTHDEVYAEKAAPTDLKRLASSEEVARATLFLASDLASAVTGQMLTVDCGEFHD